MSLVGLLHRGLATITAERVHHLARRAPPGRPALWLLASLRRAFRGFGRGSCNDDRSCGLLRDCDRHAGRRGQEGRKRRCDILLLVGVAGASLIAVTARRTLAARRTVRALRPLEAALLDRRLDGCDVRLLGTGLSLGARSVGTVLALGAFEATLAAVLAFAAVRTVATILAVVPVEAALAVPVEIALRAVIIIIIIIRPVEALAVVLAAAFAFLTFLTLAAMAVHAIAVVLALALLLATLEVDVFLAFLLAVVSVFDEGAVRLEAVAELLRHLLLGSEQNAIIVFGVLEIVLSRNRVAGGLRIASELEILLRHILRRAPDLDVRAVRLVAALQRVG
ncbi:membrane hypothetical protein [Bosea sp. EC-HK365B]|nr:membrane hypothetical protein [Bosea sp. 21B]CAD5296980.1 membrane hypothetical protein [Bosea sp. 7B]VVT61193.1 membrane hypothetical protein [Bosea sp. EC-HK365B]VXB25001.1 membrane hypothetical protein [Bosea sp. 127]